MVQLHSQRTTQIKYMKLLMQEFSIRIEMELLNALSEMFAPKVRKISTNFTHAVVPQGYNTTGVKYYILFNTMV